MSKTCTGKEGTVRWKFENRQSWGEKKNATITYVHEVLELPRIRLLASKGKGKDLAERVGAQGNGMKVDRA